MVLGLLRAFIIRGLVHYEICFFAVLPNLIVNAELQTDGVEFHEGVGAGLTIDYNSVRPDERAAGLTGSETLTKNDLFQLHEGIPSFAIYFFSQTGVPYRS
jgi:hypothetical protein